MRRAGAIAALGVAMLLGGCSHLVVLHDPLSASEHTDLGLAYERRGQPALAASEYRRALRLDRRQVRARVNLGNLAAARGDWRSAEREYRRALALQPGDADALNNLAWALLEQRRRLDEAERCASLAVAAGGARDSVYRSTLAEVRAARAR
ncbi:MAG TPA: tetratricopeptide repeat protein [Candidatus Eisenbacteria bacterium]|nr:tetratricopeptide repeat protein [Candidatus Eisenbacteria bacterium]